MSSAEAHSKASLWTEQFDPESFDPELTTKGLTAEGLISKAVESDLSFNVLGQKVINYSSLLSNFGRLQLSTNGYCHKRR
jgi:hypothetical protein